MALQRSGVAAASAKTCGTVGIGRSGVRRAVAALPAVTGDRRAHLTVHDKALHLTGAGKAAVRTQADVTPAVLSAWLDDVGRW